MTKNTLGRSTATPAVDLSEPDQTPMLHVTLLAHHAKARRARLMRWSTLEPPNPAFCSDASRVDG